MGYIVGKINSVKRKVEFDIEVDQGAPKQKADMLVTFKVRDAETTKQRMKQMQQYTTEYTRQMALLRKDPTHQIEIADVDFDADFLEEDIEDIEGLKNEDGSDVEFSPQVLQMILGDRKARMALISKWSELNLDGGQEIKRKN